MAQRNENDLVKQELDICGQEVSDGGEAVIFKQVGPVLIRNDLEEARETIEKRLEFITGEIRKAESNISSKEEQSQQLASKIQDMQASMQKAAVEAAKAVAQQQQAS